MMDSPKITGLISAPFTPMNQDGTLNIAKIKDLCDHIVATQCVNGVFICGTTGEFPSMTTDERKAVAEAWMACAKDTLKVIVHVGSNSQIQSAVLAQHAQEIGAYGIGSIAPSFFKPGSVEDLVQYFKPIAAAAPKLPFYYYNMPSMTGVSLSVTQFLLRAKEVIPSLRGVKFTHNNLMEMQQCIRLNDGEFDILHGFDEILITGLAEGAKGAVGSTYNYIPRLYKKIMDAMAENRIEDARRLQYESVKILDVVIRHGGGVRGGKVLMKLAGVDCGNCRLPIAPVTQEEEDQIRQELKETAFYHETK